MLRTAFVALYLISLPGASAWAQVVRVGTVTAVPISASAASITGAAPSALASTLVAPSLSASILAIPPSAAALAAPSATAAPAVPAASASASARVDNADGAAVPASAIPAATAEERALHSAVAARVNRSLHDTAEALSGTVGSSSIFAPMSDRFLSRALTGPRQNDGEERVLADAGTAPVAARPGDDLRRRERRTKLLNIAGAVAIIVVTATAYGALIHGWSGLVQQWENSIQETLHEDDASF